MERKKEQGGAETQHSPCLMGLKASSLEISILALVHRGTSTITEVRYSPD